jgi:hypothetical protein
MMSAVAKHSNALIREEQRSSSLWIVMIHSLVHGSDKVPTANQPAHSGTVMIEIIKHCEASPAVGTLACA